MELTIYAGIGEIERDSWNSLALGSRTPFYEWEWLALLEQSGSIDSSSGWQPLHISFNRNGIPVGIMPLYLKSHSHGEFVFDYGWADLAGQLNIPYYPKLVGTAPATPSGYYRFFCSDPAELDALLSRGISTLEDISRNNQIRGLNFLFCDPVFARGLKDFHQWENQSYLWINRDYSDFQDFLSELSKNHRRNIRREWNSLSDQGLEITAVSGADLSEGIMERMYRFYLQTNARFGPWAAKYLNRDFFLRLPEFVDHRVVIFSAHPRNAKPEEALGMSLCVYKGDWLFGRYWGGDPGTKNIHFNTCYYAPMQWMIERGMHYFDPGAGSPHKLHRGFMPHPVVSCHRFFDPLLSEIFRENIPAINRENRRMIRSMEESVPFSEKLKSELRTEIRQLFSLSEDETWGNPEEASRSQGLY
ncbi:GNAT family N-acetyltransferase [Marispirochaeta aestuarii]|uniref:GNAT family N-acetyltransferase n=1 Tax=Marispirochaeta aestuarii TaxID=1963862 RepID=UPI0029C7AD72|nr:GNAT family N-acetyltransferase [Marispirochaeta aestuarii]